MDILFVLKVKLGTFSPIHRCAFWFNLKYFCVVMQEELLEWKFWHDAELQVWPGFAGRAGLGFWFV